MSPHTTGRMSAPDTSEPEGTPAKAFPVRIVLAVIGVVLVTVAVVMTAVLVSLNNNDDDDDFSFSAETSVPRVSTRAEPFVGILNPVGKELVVSEPAVVFPLPVVDNVANNGPQQTQVSRRRSAAALGEPRYTMDSNPLVHLLRGFSSIWVLGDSDWANGMANGDGPTAFDHAAIVNPEVWESNMAYTERVCRERTTTQAIFAYLDDSRSQSFAVLDGLGPFYEDYTAATGAFSTVHITQSAVLDDRKMSVEDGGNGAGDASSELGKVVDIISLMLNSYSSTTGSEYFYMSPRPWRMTSLGDVVNLGHETLACLDENGDIHNLAFDVYDSNVSVIPALICVRRPSNTHENGTFASSSRGKD
ncbi:serine protease, partial [Diplonema papillatum]